MTEVFIGEPNERQKEFLKAKEQYVAYGGARGGGKSWALQTKIKLLASHYAGIRILLMRRTFPELRENHIIPLQTQLRGLAKYKEVDKAFTFINGSRLVFGYCATDGDVDQYQGQEYDVICIDEATQFTEYQFSTLQACVRGDNPNFPKRMYLTCNPGGVGHAWVKRLFIDKEYKKSERAEDYRFIPARVYDNKVLLDSSPGYVRMLENLPDNIREAWLNGNWDVFSGQYFNMWNRDIHVIRPFQIPTWWTQFACMDYGRDMFAAYIVVTDLEGRAYVVNEIHEPDLIISDAAKRFKERFGTGMSVIYAPPDMWHKRSDTGRSVAEIFAEHGLYLYKANNNRVQGWYDMAEWLQPYEDSEGKLQANLRIFENCRNLVRCLPLLQFDDKIPNDVSKEPHDITHAPDAIRYFIAGRPYPSSEPIKKNYWDEDEDLGSYESFFEYGR